jgi:hypothetical protein
MSRSHWKWAALVTVLALVAVWVSAQETNKTVPVRDPAVLPSSGVSSAPYNPGSAGSPSEGANSPYREAADTFASPARPTRSRSVSESNSRAMGDGSGMDDASPSATVGQTMRFKVVAKTVYESQMVPISESELRDMQSYQTLLETLRNERIPEDTKADSRVMLAKFVALQFDRDLEGREKDVVELEARVKKLREQFDKRKAARDKIIELRMTTIMNEIDGLGFPGDGGLAPGGGLAAPPYDAGTTYNPVREPLGEPFGPTRDRPSEIRPAPASDAFDAPAESFERNRSSEPALKDDVLNEPTPDDVSPTTPDTSFKPDEPVDPSNEAAGSYLAAPNLIQNGDFEMFDRQEDRAEYWDNLVPQGSEHKRVAGQGIDGSAAYLIRNAESFGDSQSTLSREIPYIPHTGNSLGLRVRFSAEVKCKADKRAVMRIGFINEQDMLQSVEPLMFLKHDSDQWVRYECEGRIPKGTKKIIFSLGNHGPGDVWLDALTAGFFEDSTSGNLLKNPSMEELTRVSSDESQEAAFWEQGAVISGVAYATDTKGGNNGSASLRIRKTDNRYFPIAEFSQKIDHTSNAPVIQLSAQVKTENATKAILDVLFLDDKGEWIKHEWAAYIGDQNAEPKPLTHDWKEYKGAVAIPAGTKQIVIGLQDYGPGTVWFDDVSAVYLKELPKEPNNVPK